MVLNNLRDTKTKMCATPTKCGPNITSKRIYFSKNFCDPLNILI